MDHSKHYNSGWEAFAGDRQPTYYIAAGDGLLYGLSWAQLEKIYEMTGIFTGNELERFDCRGMDASGFEIRIEKGISRYESEEGFQVFYTLSTRDGEIELLSYAEIKCLSDCLLAFLERFGDDGTDRITCLVRTEQEAGRESFPLEVAEDIAWTQREPVPETEVSVNKSIYLDNGDIAPHIGYTLYANEKASGILLPGQLAALRRKIAGFLAKGPDG